MPRGGKGPDAGQVLAGALGNRSPAMARAVRCCAEAFQIFDGVVERVSINVVDVIPTRDGPMHGFPDFLMKKSDATGAVASAWTEIELVRALHGVRIAPEDDTIEDNRFVFCHAINLSP